MRKRTGPRTMSRTLKKHSARHVTRKHRKKKTTLMGVASFNDAPAAGLAPPFSKVAGKRRSRKHNKGKKDDSLTWVHERPFSGGELVSVFPPKFFQDADMTMRHGEKKYYAPFYKSRGCITDMCSPQELTQACLNSLGIAMLEHQDHTDYQEVLRLYAKMTPEERMDVVDANLVSLRTYLADLFMNYDRNAGLEYRKKESLREMLLAINPFYYYYMVKTDRLPEKMRQVIYETMHDVRKLTDPLGLVRLFLEYYNTLNPYQSGGLDSVLEMTDYDRSDFISRYLRYKFLIKQISPAISSIPRYAEFMVWDLEGSLVPVGIPNAAIKSTSIVKTIAETYGDSFVRPNYIQVVGMGVAMGVAPPSDAPSAGLAEGVAMGEGGAPPSDAPSAGLAMGMGVAPPFVKVAPSDAPSAGLAPPFVKVPPSDAPSAGLAPPFVKVAPIWYVDMKRDSDKYTNLSAYGSAKQIEFIAKLTGMSYEDASDLCNKIVERADFSGYVGSRPKEDIIRDIEESGWATLLGKVYVGVLGSSIFYRFVYQFGFGGIGDINGGGGNLRGGDASVYPAQSPLTLTLTRPQGKSKPSPVLIKHTGEQGGFGVLADFMTATKPDCNTIHMNNIHPSYDRNKISVGMARSIRQFLRESAPRYLDTYPDVYQGACEGGGDGAREDMLRKIDGAVENYRSFDVGAKSAQSVVIYHADMLIEEDSLSANGFFTLATIVEVTNYANVDNDDKTELTMSTSFMILWEDHDPEIQSVFGNRCDALDGMLMKRVWTSMVAEGEGEGVAAPCDAPAAGLGVGEAEAEKEAEKEMEMEKDAANNNNVSADVDALPSDQPVSLSALPPKDAMPSKSILKVQSAPPTAAQRFTKKLKKYVPGTNTRKVRIA